MTEQPDAPRQPRVWVPRSLATGCGGQLTKIQRIVYLAIADRADNRTRIFRWDGRDIGDRCGIKDLRTVRAARDRLVEVGLLEVVSESPRGMQVHVGAVKSSGRLEVPLIAVWDGADGPPRSADNPSGAFAALLGLLYYANFQTNRVAIRHETMAEKIGSSRRQFIRDLEDLRTMLGDKVLVESRTHRDKGRWGATEFTIVWDNASDYVTRAEAALNSAAATGITEGGAEGEHPDAASESVQTICHLLYNAIAKNGHVPLPKLQRSTEGWPAVASALIDDGYTGGQVADLILWSTQDNFWLSRVHGMEDIQHNVKTMISRVEFRDWVTLQNGGHWNFPPLTAPAKKTTSRTSSARYAPARTPSEAAYLTPNRD